MPLPIRIKKGLSVSHTYIPSEQEINEWKYIVKWGTYGKNGDEPLRYVRLIDCSSEHLENIIKNLNIFGFCHNRTYEEIAKAILRDRKHEKEEPKTVRIRVFM